MFDTSRVIYGTVGLLPSVTKKKKKKKSKPEILLRWNKLILSPYLYDYQDFNTLYSLLPVIEKMEEKTR